MANITFSKSNTALIIADYYTEAVGKLPHAVNRKCIEKTLALRAAARAAGMLVCYTATVFRRAEGGAIVLAPALIARLRSPEKRQEIRCLSGFG